LGFVRQNAKAAGVKVETAMSDVTTWIDAQPDASFDAIVCDPPSFIRSRKQAGKGANAYGRLFAKVLTKVRRGGYVVLASCSHHLYDDRFHKAVSDAGYKARREIISVMQGGQSPCHPVPTTFPEARYLKTVLVEAR
jgi:23S rRNA (cytosine1962-C5)-methyltransferase